MKRKSEEVYIIETPYGRVVYGSARDALGVFETTSGEYKVVIPAVPVLAPREQYTVGLTNQRGHVPVRSDTVGVLLEELANTGELKFLQPGFTLTRAIFYPSLGAK